MCQLRHALKRRWRRHQRGRRHRHHSRARMARAAAAVLPRAPPRAVRRGGMLDARGERLPCGLAAAPSTGRGLSWGQPRVGVTADRLSLAAWQHDSLNAKKSGVCMSQRRGVGSV